MKLFSLLAAAATAEFNAQPTDGQRVCEYYNLKAKAIFDVGSTESVEGALADGFDKVILIILYSFLKQKVAYN